MSASWSVAIEERGRDGTVVYRDDAGEIACHWEFCGGDAVAAVSVGTVAAWQARHPWAVERRTEIVRRIGSEVLRQRAPSCRYEMDESNGWLTVVPAGDGPGSPTAPPPGPPIPIPAAVGLATSSSADFVRTLYELRSKAALVAVVVVVLLGAAIWIGGALFTVRTVGSPNGNSIRVGNTIATMIGRLVPYVPSLHRDPSKDRHSIGILLHAADGSLSPRYIEVAASVTSEDLGKSRLIGSDAQRIWFIAPDLGAIDLAASRVLSESELAAVQALAPKPTGRLADLATGERALEWLSASGGMLSPVRFIATMGDADAKDDIKVGGAVRETIDRLDKPSQPERLWVGDVALDSGRPRLTSVASTTGPAVYFASFLRASRGGPLLVLPANTGTTPGVLRLFEKSRFPRGTVSLSRIDESGDATWEADLGIERLEESLPDPVRPAFIGRLPAAPNALGEPVLVVVDAATGTTTRHSLLMK